MLYFGPQALRAVVNLSSRVRMDFASIKAPGVTLANRSPR